MNTISFFMSMMKLLSIAEAWSRLFEGGILTKILENFCCRLLIFAILFKILCEKQISVEIFDRNIRNKINMKSGTDLDAIVRPTDYGRPESK